MRLTTLFAVLFSVTLAASVAYPPPQFSDPGRVAKLRSAMPEIDGLFRTYATDKKIPGMVWGVVIDGQLAHLGILRRPRRAQLERPSRRTPRSALHR